MEPAPSTSTQNPPPTKKKCPKNKVKRMLLAREESAIVQVDESTSELLMRLAVDCIKEFNQREDLHGKIVLGFNEIMRRAEDCNDELCAVLLNPDTRPLTLTAHLAQLCSHESIPCGSISNFGRIVDALKPIVKGLKNNVTAIGILSGCSHPLVEALVDKLPCNQPRIERPLPKKARAKPPPPPPPMDCKSFYVSALKAPPRKEGEGFGNVVALGQEGLPFIDYVSFIGSDSPMSTGDHKKQQKEKKEKPSKYKKPFLKVR